MEIFEKHLIVQCFEEDNYVMNSDVPDTYVKMQVANSDLAGAIRTKKRFQTYLRENNSKDH